MALAATAAPPPCLVVATETPGVEWNAYVDARPDASVYHRAEWSALVERTFRHPTTYLVAREDGRIAGILPLVCFNTPLFGRFVTSMPFVNYGGLVADSARVRDALFAAAIDEGRARHASYVELRHTERVFANAPVLTHKVAMVLPLAATVDEQWRALDGKVRNQVRKAEKSGLSARLGGAELLEAFYHVLSRNMRDLGSPVHSRRFFAEVLATFPRRTRVFAVFLDGAAVAASLVIWDRDRLEVPWASAIRDYNTLCPNMLLYWEMVKFGIERRFSTFDFGRSTPNEGTYHFKAQWGARAQPLHWEYWLAPGVELPNRGPSNPKFATAVALWARLPVRIASRLGPRIVRNIP